MSKKVKELSLDVDKAMQLCNCENRIEFVKLLRENGMVLTTQTLVELKQTLPYTFTLTSKIAELSGCTIDELMKPITYKPKTKN